jgi:threonine dehydrogenase-like Zn-dependent dehydrogenase
VALVGTGALAQIAARIMLRDLANGVVVLGQGEQWRSQFEALGGPIAYFDWAESDPRECLRQHLPAHGADVVIDTTGLQEGLDAAMSLVRSGHERGKGGTLSLLEPHRVGTRTLDLGHVDECGIRVTGAPFVPAWTAVTYIRQGIDLVQSSLLDLSAMIRTEGLALGAIDEVFRFASERADGLAYAVVEIA